MQCNSNKKNMSNCVRVCVCGGNFSDDGDKEAWKFVEPCAYMHRVLEIDAKKDPEKLEQDKWQFEKALEPLYYRSLCMYIYISTRRAMAHCELTYLAIFKGPPNWKRFVAGMQRCTNHPVFCGVKLISRIEVTSVFRVVCTFFFVFCSLVPYTYTYTYTLQRRDVPLCPILF